MKDQFLLRLCIELIQIIPSVLREITRIVELHMKNNNKLSLIHI